MIASLLAAGFLFDAGAECTQDAALQLAKKLAHLELLRAGSAAEQPTVPRAYGEDIAGR